MKTIVRNTLFPLFLIISCPFTALFIWYTNVMLNGSLLALWHLIIQNGFLHTLLKIWRPYYLGTVIAWKMILVFMLVQLILMRLVPGKKIEGPITPKGNIPEYKNNGFSCYLITLTLFITCSLYFHLFSPTIIYDNFAGILGALNIFSLLFCGLLLIKGRIAPSSSDCGTSKNIVFDYYWGTELYPRIFGWDVKVFTNCRFGMMSWPLIILSFAAYQAKLYGLSNSMLVAVTIMLIYVSKFFWWESGYLRSLDIMHDRAGFYICWGCLVWVPTVYTSPIQYLVNHPNHLSTITAIVILIAGIASVMINYLADAQRQKVRSTNGKCTVWAKSPRLLKATYITSEGEHKSSLLLLSGWWGLSRHFHYIPEILGAFFWTLPALFENILPYFYVVFLTILLIHRSNRDEQRCHNKYGDAWKAYCREVPNRILPINFKHWFRG